MKKLEIFRGDHYPLIFKMVHGYPKKPLDLTGLGLTMVADERSDPPDESTRLFNLTGEILGEPTEGRVSFTPTAENTTVAPGEYWYSIKYTDAAFNERTLNKQRLIIIGDLD